MNYEIQHRRPQNRKWFYWSTTAPRIKDSKRHIELLRKTHPDRKFRIFSRKPTDGTWSFEEVPNA